MTTNLILEQIQNKHYLAAFSLIQKMDQRTALTNYLHGFNQFAQSRYERAVHYLEKANKIAPADKDIAVMLLDAYVMLNDKEKILELAYSALLLHKNDFRFSYYIAVVSAKENPKLALDLFNKSLALNPPDEFAATIYAAISSIQIDLADYEEAEKYAVFSILTHANSEAYLHLSLCALQHLNFKLARQSLESAEKLKMLSEHRSGFILSMIELTEGNISKGLELYENRIFFNQKLNQHKILKRNQEAKSVQIVPEQGLGDFIQFARFIPELKKKIPDVIIVCPDNPFSETYKDFYETQYENLSKVLQLSGTVNINDWKIKQDIPVLPIMSISNYLGYTSWENLPAPVSIDCCPINTNLCRFASDRGNYTVLSWKGSIGHTNNSMRSMTKEEAQLIIDQNPQEKWVNIDLSVELKNCENIGKEIKSIRDLAWVLSFAKQFVGIDSLPLHVAGSFQVKGYLLQSYLPDWRWGLSEKNLWYPNITNIRKDHCTIDWINSNVINKVTQRLQQN